jgi:hypothetical protein
VSSAAWAAFCPMSHIPGVPDRRFVTDRRQRATRQRGLQVLASRRTEANVLAHQMQTRVAVMTGIPSGAAAVELGELTAVLVPIARPWPLASSWMPAVASIAPECESCSPSRAAPGRNSYSDFAVGWRSFPIVCTRSPAALADCWGRSAAASTWSPGGGSARPAFKLHDPRHERGPV